MALGPREYNRMTMWILLGLTKDECPIDWTDEVDAAWDRLTVEIAEIKANGHIVDMVNE